MKIAYYRRKRRKNRESNGKHVFQISNSVEAIERSPLLQIKGRKTQSPTSIQMQSIPDNRKGNHSGKKKYRFTPQMIIKMEKRNAEFRNLLASDNFFYYDGFVCRPSVGLFEKEKGIVRINTDQLFSHPEQHCISYGIRKITIESGRTIRRFAFTAPSKQYYPQIEKNDLLVLFTSALDGLGDNSDPFVTRLLAALDGPPKVSKRELSYRTGLSTQTIYRMTTPVQYKKPAKLVPVDIEMSEEEKKLYLEQHKAERTPRFELSSIVACAVGLHMLPMDSKALLLAGGYILRDNIPIERAYEMILSLYYTMPVASCNDYLEMHGLPPMTDNYRISSYA